MVPPWEMECKGGGCSPNAAPTLMGLLLVAAIAGFAASNDTGGVVSYLFLDFPSIGLPYLGTFLYHTVLPYIILLLQIPPVPPTSCGPQPLAPPG